MCIQFHKKHERSCTMIWVITRQKLEMSLCIFLLYRCIAASSALVGPTSVLLRSDIPFVAHSGGNRRLHERGYLVRVIVTIIPFFSVL